MSTICWDGETLVVDSLDVAESTRRQNQVKRLYVASELENWSVEGKRALAFAFIGQGLPGLWILEGLTAGLTLNKRPQGKHLHFQAVIVCEDCAFAWRVYVDASGDRVVDTLIPLTGPEAFGTGMSMATGLLSIGVPARKAMEVVTRWELESGGELQCFTRPPLRQTSREDQLKHEVAKRITLLKSKVLELDEGAPEEERDQLFNELQEMLAEIDTITHKQE